MTITTEDETLALVFSIVEGGEIDAALDEIDAMLSAEFSEITLGEAESQDVNGLPFIFINGEADGLDIIVAVVDCPSGQVMLISGFAAPETVAAYATDIQAVFGSIAPSY